MATMATNQQHLGFIQEKIREIGSAIFYNQSDSLLKLPTSIVSTLCVDDFGYVWFFVQTPRQTLMEFETEFPARMDFFKKGKGYFLQVSGKGWVVSDPEEMNTLESIPESMKELALQNMLLVKVKIMKAEYYETTPGKVKSGWWKSALQSVSAWFGSSTYRPDVYYPAS